MKRLSAIALLAFLQPAHAIDIVFDYSADTSGFFASSVRRDTLEAAASVFESRLTDVLGAITPGTGFNTYTLSASHPGGGSEIQLVDVPIAQNEIRIFVGARNLSSLGFASSSFSASGTTPFVDMVQGRGQAGALASPPTDFGPWGGSIAFRSTAEWHDDHATAVASDRSDLYSVAVHEIGHLLGVGTAGSWNAQVSGLQFNGAAATALHGGPVPLASGAGHWASGTQSPINGAGSFETAMDPEVLNGVRKAFTDLDWAALQDIGWQVAPIPEPQTWMTMLAGIALLGTAIGRRQRIRGAL
jgi:hypothetical protein